MLKSTDITTAIYEYFSKWRKSHEIEILVPFVIPIPIN